MISKIKDYCGAFFLGLSVNLLPALVIEESEDGDLSITIKNTATPRSKRIVNQTHILPHRNAHPYDIDKVDEDSRQLKIDNLLRLVGDLVPNDAAICIGVTMEDLYKGMIGFEIPPTDIFFKTTRTLL